MKKHMTAVLLIFLIFPALAIAVGVPTNVTLTNATQTSITVSWGGVDTADRYNIYWGTSNTTLDKTHQVGSSLRQYVIPDLTQNTTYYVQVSAVNDSTGEGNRSLVVSGKTQQDTNFPAVPTGFTVTSPNAITQNSVTLKWNQNSETDLDHYEIDYGTVSGTLSSSKQATNSDADAFVVTGLTSSTRYYFAITAFDTASNKSDTSAELIVDTLDDTRPPFTPDGFTGELSGQNEITVRISDGNSQMADFKGNKIFYGTSVGAINQSVDIGSNTSYTLGNLSEGSTWYFQALAYDIHDNQSEKTTEIFVKVEATQSFLGQSGEFDGGCFIGTSSQSFGSKCTFLLLILIMGLLCYIVPKKFRIIGGIALILLVAENYAIAREAEPIKNNAVGFSVGYFVPAESDFKRFYDNTITPVFGFYERRIYKFITADIEAGYIKENGNLLTVSGASTSIASELTVVPVAATLKLERELMPFIVGYVGIGPDYWYYREKTEAITENNNIKEWIGGYHGKVGVKLYNMDENFKNTGAILECIYSRIDRFGENDLELGGLTVKLGFFYQF